MRSKTLREVSDGTTVNFMVEYKALMKSVKSLSLVTPWVHRSKMWSLYRHHNLGLIVPDLAFWSITPQLRCADRHTHRPCLGILLLFRAPGRGSVVFIIGVVPEAFSWDLVLHSSYGHLIA